MTKTLGKELDQPNPSQMAKEARLVARRVLSQSSKDRKPTGPVTYTIEKGANVWPWQSK